MARDINGQWDQHLAETRLPELGIPLRRRAGKFSGGQQAQLALTVALGRHPGPLLLDEPMARLDPLARHDFMAALMTTVCEQGMSVVYSSHVIAELERVADYLVVLSRGSVQLAGAADQLIAEHRSLGAGGRRQGRSWGRAGCILPARLDQRSGGSERLDLGGAEPEFFEYLGVVFALPGRQLTFVGRGLVREVPRAAGDLDLAARPVGHGPYRMPLPCPLAVRELLDAADLSGSDLGLVQLGVE